MGAPKGNRGSSRSLLLCASEGMSSDHKIVAVPGEGGLMAAVAALINVLAAKAFLELDGTARHELIGIDVPVYAPSWPCAERPG
jgi:hypothetical protein